jgi:hypothetical protein
MRLEELYAAEPQTMAQVHEDIETIQQMLEEWKAGGDVGIEDACCAAMSLASIASRRRFWDRSLKGWIEGKPSRRP